MIALLRVELTRLRWRRAVVALIGLGVAVSAVMFAATVVSTHQQSLDELVSEYGPDVTRQIEGCTRHPRQYGVEPDGDPGAACELVVQGYFGNHPLDLIEQRESASGPAVIALLTLVMLLVGTTFAGHDWNTGSMSNQLLFEPRRHRVWLAKLLAVGLVAGVIAGVVLLAHWTGLYAVSSARDLVQPEHSVAAAYKQAVLGTMLVGAAGALGYGLTMLLRSTVATLGLMFATAVSGVVVISAGVESAERVLPWGNFLAFVVGRYEYFVYSDCFAAECNPARHIDRSDSAVYFLVVLAVVVAASIVSFRSRDVP